MIIVDKKLEKLQEEQKPIRIALIGTGYMGKGIALQIITGMIGMRLVAIYDRTIMEARKTYDDAGVLSPALVTTVKGAEEEIARGNCIITDDPLVLCRAGNIDAVIEATGEIEFGATVALEAINYGKHVVLMNAELDATLGPILKVYADKMGVVITNTDGDEPGVAMNLFRQVKTMGLKPVLAGNIKGFIDPYRTPETQREFAERNKQKPKMITSFADGTKLSMELTVLANATGFKVGKRGMFGPRCTHVKDVINHFSAEQFKDTGLVDYALGAEPGTGAFVVGYDAHPTRQQYMKYFKMGDGPLYLFYTPYHLPHLQLPLSVARAVLYNDATITPLGAPSCDVVTVAKRNLKSGEVLDGIGGFTCYGLIENADSSRSENLLPMGLSEGCKLRRDVPKDQCISYEDVELPEGRFADKLRGEQNSYFSLGVKSS